MELKDRFTSEYILANVNSSMVVSVDSLFKLVFFIINGNKIHVIFYIFYVMIRSFYLLSLYKNLISKKNPS
jgi:hypothetical protein